MTFRLVRYSRCEAPAEPLLLVSLRAERLDDAVAGERFGRDVRQLLELFLAAPRRAANALAEPHERIDHERRAGDRHERQPRVLVEEKERQPDERRALRASDRRPSPTPPAAPD